MSRLASILLVISLCTSFAIIASEDGALTGDPAAGQIKSAVCAACHGVDGNSITPIWPKLAGMSQAYLYKQLLEYQKGPQGDRNEPTMAAIVASLTPQDLADLAAYFASQEMTLGVVQQSMLPLGQKIYRGGNLLSGVPACAACHDANGKGNYLANFPRLGGQNSEYIADQLHKFAKKERVNIMMNDIAAKLTEAEIQAVASYVAGLH